jgi:hypothetical protein
MNRTSLPPKKLLGLISKFSKGTRHHINIQKSVALLFLNTQLSETEIKKAMPLTIATKNLEISLTKEVKDLYNEKVKEIEKHTQKKERIFHVLSYASSPGFE